MVLFVQTRTQPGESALDARPDGLDGHVQPIGYGPRRQALDEPEQDRGPIRLVQLQRTARHPLHLLGA